MDLFLQLLGDDIAVGSKRYIIMRALEKMMIDVARQLMPVIMKPIIRRVVQEELAMALEKVLPSMKMNSGNRGSTSESPSLQLQFLSKMNPEVWTGSKKGEENLHIEVALIDGQTGEVVKSGPESEAKVEIVALDGDFVGNGEGDIWTSEEFNNKIVRECKGKKSILRGKTYLKLKEGKGLFRDISFTHSKDWMKNHEFRLGAKIVDSVFMTAIKEAKTDSFILKDRRSTLNKKHYPPSPSDAVWRLEKIQRDGAYHNRLTEANINTVKDFLTLLAINPKELQNILKVCAAPKIWKAIVDHAQTCQVNEGLYKYNDASYEQNTEVVFNTHGRLMGLIIESQYVPVDQLSENKKADGQKSVKSASEHWLDVVSLTDDEASLTHASSVESLSSLTREISAGSNSRTPLLVSDQGSPTGSRIAPIFSGQGSPTGSNCTIPPLGSDQQSLNSRNPLLFSDQGSPIGNNCGNSPLVSHPEHLAGSNCRNSPLVNDQQCPTDTSTSINDHPQPSSSSHICFDSNWSANNLDFWPSDDNIENSSFAFQTHYAPIPSPETNNKYYDDLWQSYSSDNNLQQDIPNVEMAPEQQGSASGFLVVASEAICMDPTQKICKMVRQLSITRIGATEPEGMHIEKKQRGC